MSTAQQNKLRMKESIAELEYTNAQQGVDALHQSNMDIIHRRKDMECKHALAVYENALITANAKFEGVKKAYDCQRDMSLSKCKREYDRKKQLIEKKRKAIEEKVASFQNLLT